MIRPREPDPRALRAVRRLRKTGPDRGLLEGVAVWASRGAWGWHGARGHGQKLAGRGYIVPPWHGRGLRRLIRRATWAAGEKHPIPAVYRSFRRRNLPGSTPVPPRPWRTVTQGPGFGGRFRPALGPGDPGGADAAKAAEGEGKSADRRLEGCRWPRSGRAPPPPFTIQLAVLGCARYLGWLDTSDGTALWQTDTWQMHIEGGENVPEVPFPLRKGTHDR